MPVSNNKLTAVGMPPELAKQVTAGIPSAQPAMQAIVALTAETGTTGNTISDVGGAFSQATLNNNFKALADKVNAILAQLKA
jgi:hypothetical protein